MPELDERGEYSNLRLDNQPEGAIRRPATVLFAGIVTREPAQGQGRLRASQNRTLVPTR
jgi:hypothetical protein